MLIEARSSILPPVRKAVKTRVDTESPAALHAQREERYREAWQNVIDNKLIEWGSDPSQLDEEGTKTPSLETIQLAIQLAKALSRQGCAAPTRIVPDVRGAIVFEIQGKDIFESVHVQPDGNLEHRLFENHRLVHREPWVIETADNK
jgi:hypothetical protein